MSIDTEFGQLTKTLIQTKVLEAMKGSEDYIDSLVQAAFKQEVNEYGHKPDYHNRQTMPWLEWCVGDTIRTATRRAVLKCIEEIEPQIEASVRKSLTSDKVVSAFTRKLIDSLGTEGGRYNIDVVFKDTEKEE